MHCAQRCQHGINRVAAMHLARLAAHACKYRQAGPVLQDTLRQQYLAGGLSMCIGRSTHEQQLRRYGFGSRMNDNDPVHFHLS